MTSVVLIIYSQFSINPIVTECISKGMELSGKMVDCTNVIYKIVINDYDKLLIYCVVQHVFLIKDCCIALQIKEI